MRKIPEGYEDTTWSDLPRAFYHFVAAVWWLLVLALCVVKDLVVDLLRKGLEGEGCRTW